MSSTIQVKPKDLFFEISKLELSFENFTLHAVDGYVNVTYFTNAGFIVHIERVYIPPNIYSQWGTDDTFITDYVLQQIHFEKQ